MRRRSPKHQLQPDEHFDQRVRRVIDDMFVLADTPLRRALARVPAVVPSGTVFAGPEAGAPGAPAFRPLSSAASTAPAPSLGAWVRTGGFPMTVSGVYWFLPVTTYSAFPALAETAFVVARTVLGESMLIGGQFALPALRVTGVRLELDGGPLAAGPDTIVFQPRISRQGGAWLDEGDYGELLGEQRVLEFTADTLLAPGDAWTLQAYTTGDAVTIGGLKLTVIFAA